MDTQTQRKAILGQKETAALIGDRKQQKRRLKAALEDFLSTEVDTQQPHLTEYELGKLVSKHKLSMAELVTLGQLEEAILNRNTRAAEWVRDTSGEKPREEIYSTSASPLSGLTEEQLTELLDKLGE